MSEDSVTLNTEINDLNISTNMKNCLKNARYKCSR